MADIYRNGPFFPAPAIIAACKANLEAEKPLHGTIFWFDPSRKMNSNGGYYGKVGAIVPVTNKRGTTKVLKGRLRYKSRLETHMGGITPNNHEMVAKINERRQSKNLPPIKPRDPKNQPTFRFTKWNVEVPHDKDTLEINGPLPGDDHLSGVFQVREFLHMAWGAQIKEWEEYGARVVGLQNEDDTDNASEIKALIAKGAYLTESQVEKYEGDDYDVPSALPVLGDKGVTLTVQYKVSRQSKGPNGGKKLPNPDTRVKVPFDIDSGMPATWPSGDPRWTLGDLTAPYRHRNPDSRKPDVLRFDPLHLRGKPVMADNIDAITAGSEMMIVIDNGIYNFSNFGKSVPASLITAHVRVKEGARVDAAAEAGGRDSDDEFGDVEVRDAKKADSTAVAAATDPTSGASAGKIKVAADPGDVDTLLAELEDGDGE